MAVHSPDPGNISSGKPQKILVDRQVVYTVHIQISGEHQVQHLSDFAGETVLDGQHRNIAFSLFHGFVR